MNSAALAYAVLLPTMIACHYIADYWVQTHHQALTKGGPRREGPIACLKHVITYTLTASVFVVLAWLRFDLHITVLGFALGQLVNAGTHYWADRRTPLLRLADRLGKGEFARLGTPRPGHDDNVTLGTGAHMLDQAWHIGWLLIAAHVTVSF